MDSYSVKHRWCNKDFGRQGTLTASNSCHSRGRNYFSYSTVFGQWVDLEKNVVLVYNGSTSPTSCKYKLYKSEFPKDVHVLPYDDGGHSYYHGCNLVSSYDFEDKDFSTSRRMVLLDYYVQEMYNHFENITTSKSKGAENVSFDMWGYFEELCSLYNDISAAKYLKTLKKVKCKKEAFKSEKEYVKKYNAAVAAKKVMVKLLAAGERDVKKITDAMFGEGSYQKYIDYCEKFRKADRNKQFVIDLCHRLGMSNPYQQWDRGVWASNPYKPAEIRKMTAKQRNEVHFANLETIEYANKADERKQKYNRNRENAFKWIVGYECDKKSGWRGYEYDDAVTKCRNMFTGEEYEIERERIFGFYWCSTAVSFNYDNFRKSEDKEQWIADFYAYCKEVADNRKALGILKRIKAHIKEKARSWDDDVYINDDYLRENTTDSEYNLCAEFIRKQDKHYADEEARRRAAEIARLKAEEERKREEEFKAQVKQEQIDECLERGEEGCRDLWRKHLMDIHYAERETNYKGDFFMGGNVLLRLNLNKDKVETSKYIKIPVEVCKKMWKIVSKWHENPSCFKPMEIDTKGSGRYTISSYENDILTAGCHKIAYTEMERMYNEIIAAV